MKNYHSNQTCMKPYFIIILTILWINCTVTSGKTTTETIPETALMAYMKNNDKSFKWEIIDSTQIADVKGYRLHLVSQTWRNITWNHELVVLIPQTLKHNEALLHLTGGSEDETTGEIKYHSWEDETIQTMGRIAHNNKATTAILWQVPRQPLFGGRYEDVLVSYTYHQFQQSGDFTWPLLFPMAKSAVRAMDAISQLAQSLNTHKKVDRFVVNGVSKRGWTTWMAAATEDPRIVAIAPMVIDILNMPVNVEYQKHMYGDYSIEIKDYVNLGLTETVKRKEGMDLVKMVDPYSYKGKYKLPKMLFMGTNDEYWTVDAVKNYIDEIPGHKLLTYTPNAGHGLGSKEAAILSLEAFFYQTIHGKKYPTCTHSASQKGRMAEIRIKTGKGTLVGVELWEASSETKDFRKSKFKATAIPLPRKKSFSIKVNLPEKNFKAFMVMLHYKHPTEQKPYTICTRMYTSSSDVLYDKPFKPEL